MNCYMAGERKPGFVEMIRCFITTALESTIPIVRRKRVSDSSKGPLL